MTRRRALLGLGAAAAPEPMRIAAASDLAVAEQDLMRSSPVKDVRFAFGSSGVLARQIRSGAPFDVFLSASEEYVKQLADGGDIERASICVYALGRVGLWSKDGLVRSLPDLLSPRVKHVAIPNPLHAPYGIAAKAALESRGVWKAVEPKIVYGENVRQALQFAESGNADAVLTSWTLLHGRGVLLPAEWHAPVRQAGGVLAASKRKSEARRFLAFLLSDAGQAILSSHGLFRPEPR